MNRQLISNQISELTKDLIKLAKNRIDRKSVIGDLFKLINSANKELSSDEFRTVRNTSTRSTAANS
jgi:hypothetical protein